MSRQRFDAVSRAIASSYGVRWLYHAGGMDASDEPSSAGDAAAGDTRAPSRQDLFASIGYRGDIGTLH
jgi:hypothetical protein